MGLIVGLFVLACVGVLIGVALRISAAVLRTAVSLTNAVLGGREQHEDDLRRPAYDTNPLPRPKSLAGLLVPVPGVGYAVLLIISTGVASAAAQFAAVLGTAAVLARTAPDPVDALNPVAPAASLGVLGAGVAAGLLATLVVLKATLPTTFARAAVVVFWQFAISALLGALLFLVAYALAPEGGGRLPVPVPRSNVWFK